MPLSQSSEHKKPDFVLEMPENEGSEGLGAHGLCGRVANSAGNGCLLARDAGVGCWKWLPPGRGQMLRHRTKKRRG